MQSKTHGNEVAARSPWAAALVVCAALLGFSSCSGEPAEGGADAVRPNVLFVLVDTLRWDHLSTYGYGRPTSPRVDALGAAGWVFENHISHAGQTVPATISMLVSKYPVEHGYVHEGPGHFAKNPPYFHSELVFLAEVLREAGYRTGGFVANPFLKKKHNFHQGFERFVHSRARGEVLTAAARRWIEGVEESENGDSTRPYFAYLHLMDVHSPYNPPAGYRNRYPQPRDGRYVYRNGLLPDARPADVAFTVAMYDAQVNYIDDLLAELLDGLEASGHLENTLIVFTGDHGDEFLEHGGLGHGTSVYGELVRVPLILCWPERLAPGRRIESITQHVDLAPALLDLVGCERPPSFRGDSLFEPTRPVFAENGPWRAVYSDGGKLVVNLELNSTALFDAADALDQTRLTDEVLERRLQSLLAGYLGLEAARHGHGEEAKTSWTDEELSQLQALGYTE